MTCDVASLFQKQAENQENQQGSLRGPWVCSLLPCGWGALSTLAAPISSVKPQRQQKTGARLWRFFVLFLLVPSFLISIFLFRIQFQILKVV